MGYKDIKKLFDDEKNVDVISNVDADAINEELESVEFLRQKQEERNRFFPDIRYNEPENFAFYGSAEAYYKDSIQYIRKTYPYDGSLMEKQEWENHASYLDNYIFKNYYPRTTGYVTFSTASTSNAWGSRTSSRLPAFFSSLGGNGLTFGAPSIPEYIFVKGGPHPDPDTDYKSILSKANIFNTSSFCCFGKNTELEFRLGNLFKNDQ